MCQTHTHDRAVAEIPHRDGEVHDLAFDTARRDVILYGDVEIRGFWRGKNRRAVARSGRDHRSAFDHLHLIDMHAGSDANGLDGEGPALDRKSTRLNSSHGYISYAVFCLKKKKQHSV